MSVSYPAPGVSLRIARVPSPSASSAQTLILVAWILQAIAVAIFLGGIGFLVVYSALYPYPYAALAVAGGIGLGILLGAFLYLAYTLSYERVRAGQLAEAQTPTLVIGILSLFAGVLPGIFYILGYVKIGDAIHEEGPGFAGSPATYGPAFPPPPAATCAGCGRAYAVGSVAYCPACGRKLTA